MGNSFRMYESFRYILDLTYELSQLKLDGIAERLITAGALNFMLVALFVVEICECTNYAVGDDPSCYVFDSVFRTLVAIYTEMVNKRLNTALVVDDDIHALIWGRVHDLLNHEIKRFIGEMYYSGLHILLAIYFVDKSDQQRCNMRTIMKKVDVRQFAFRLTAHIWVGDEEPDPEKARAFNDDTEKHINALVQTLND